MKKLIKRIVPILLSVFMLFGVLDMPVYASQSDKEENTSYSFADESYEIKGEGSYKAKDCFVSEKKSNRSGDTEFSSFQSELPST